MTRSDRWMTFHAADIGMTSPDHVALAPGYTHDWVVSFPGSPMVGLNLAQSMTARSSVRLGTGRTVYSRKHRYVRGQIPAIVLAYARGEFDHALPESDQSMSAGAGDTPPLIST